MNTEDIERLTGLNEAAAAELLARDGYNELPSQKKQGSFEIFLHVISEPMLLLLLGCGLMYVLIGEAKDALVLLSFVLVVISITFYQERKTERTLEKLKNLSSPRALVIREGKRRRVPGREVVCGDIIFLMEGDRVPADALVIEASNLSADESLLTGESMPVRKCAGEESAATARPGGDDLPFVYSASLIVSGHGIAKILTTGAHTEIGKIGKAIQGIKEEETLLHKETKKIVRYITVGGLVLCALVVLLYVVLKGSLIQGILAGLTLSMAMLPEEFPVVLIIFLTLGAWRISKKKVLTRRPAAIETLGAATVLAVDKTGTLTMNRMTLGEIYTSGATHRLTEKKDEPLPEEFHELIEYSLLASQRDPFDPIEKEIRAAGEAYLEGTEHIHTKWEIVKEYPLSKELLCMAHAWESPNKEELIVAAKGAPEAMADICHMNGSEREEVLARVHEMSHRGFRLLGVAKAITKKADIPGNQHDFDFSFVGLIGFIDPIRPTVRNALKEAYTAGIRTIMITGDHPGTAISVAREIGLENPEEYITGDVLSTLDPVALKERMRTANIFARVVPEQKLLIVNALKENGEIVAMTGDGVNDAPALKAAHIGIAMGERGTDVAREASSLVLLNDDFSSIVAAVRLGRRIFENLRKAMGYILAIHIPIAGIAILPVALGLPIVFLPVHIAFLELIIDPACSTVFEADPEEKDIMKKPPLDLLKPLFGARTIAASAIQGFSVLAITFGSYIIALYTGKGELDARTISFTILVLANIALVVANLSWSKSSFRILRSPNTVLGWFLAGVIIMLGLILYVPALRDLFHFSYLHSLDIIVALGTAFLSLLWFETLKSLRFKRT